MGDEVYPFITWLYSIPFYSLRLLIHQCNISLHIQITRLDHEGLPFFIDRINKRTTYDDPRVAPAPPPSDVAKDDIGNSAARITLNSAKFYDEIEKATKEKETQPPDPPKVSKQYTGLLLLLLLLFVCLFWWLLLVFFHLFFSYPSIHLSFYRYLLYLVAWIIKKI